MSNKQYGIAQYESSDVVPAAFEPFGEVNKFFHYTGQEAMLAGPYDTGKTFGMLQKVNLLMWMFPNVHALMVRKSYKALLPSAIQTLYTKVLKYPPWHPLCEVSVYGGGIPQWITWPNGSQLKLGGMDEPTKVLSSEYDYIVVPQAEELELNDWEQLLSRCNGRAGNVPWPQIMGDCNPDVPLHWIQQREPLKVFNTTHEDNPTLFQRDLEGELVRDGNGNSMPTKGGELRIKTLQSMTGLRYKRGYLGLWVGAEGAVFEDFDSKVHVMDQFPIPSDWKRYRSIDFGYTHPFVCGWWAEDEDGRLYLYRQLYMSKRTVNKHVNGDKDLGIYGIKHYSQIDIDAGCRFHATVADWDAEDRATLEEHGIGTINADKRIQVGIEKMQDRLVVQADGKPRIFFLRNSLVELDDELKTAYRPTELLGEMTGYVWESVANKAERAKDEHPIKKDDHAIDMTRYMIMYKDGKKTGRTKATRYA